MKKGVLLALLVVSALLAGYCVFAFALGAVFYPEFYEAKEEVCAISDLWGGFIPQGVTILGDKTIICGYMTGDEPSRLYVSDGKTALRIDLQREDGSVYGGHAGGITANGDYLYISNASKIFVLRASDVLSAGDGDTVAFIGRFEVPCRSSYCSSDGEYLYVGEYHADGYETDESHLVNTADGAYQALTFAYKFTENGEFGVETEPCRAYATPDKAQGFAVNADKAHVSCSAGLEDSMLHVYSVKGEPDGEILGLPLYILDSKRETQEMKMPHMSEDLEFRSGWLYTGFEAGALKFGGGLLPNSVSSIVRLRILAIPG